MTALNKNPLLGVEALFSKNYSRKELISIARGYNDYETRTERRRRMRSEALQEKRNERERKLREEAIFGNINENDMLAENQLDLLEVLEG